MPGHGAFHLSNVGYLSVLRQELCHGSVNYRFISGCLLTNPGKDYQRAG